MSNEDAAMCTLLHFLVVAIIAFIGAVDSHQKRVDKKLEMSQEKWSQMFYTDLGSEFNKWLFRTLFLTIVIFFYFSHV